MGFLASPIAKTLAVLGIAGTAVGVPLSIAKSKSSFRAGAEAVEVKVSKELFDNRGRSGSGLSSLSEKHLPRNCRSIVSSDTTLRLEELFWCPSSWSPIKPLFYFYEAQRPSEDGIAGGSTVKAHKVKHVSYSQEQSSGYLLITLEDESQKRFTPSSIASWAFIKDLNPENECLIDESSGTNGKLSCQQSLGDKKMVEISSWIK